MNKEITKIRPVAQRTFDALILDMPVTPASQIDFGIDTVYHYAALQRAVRSGCSMEELDKALGSGIRITALVNKYAPEFKNVKFHTSYDDLN